MHAHQAVFDGPHFRAAVRVALRAQGFKASRTEVDRVVEERYQIGCRLRDMALLERLPAFVTSSDYFMVADADPFLWGRLPHMLGFGYQQAMVLRNPTSSPEVDERVALLSATFSAGIALVDYLVDEGGHGALVFEALNYDVVRGMFDPAADVEAFLAEVYGRSTDPRLRLLCALVASCVNEFRELYRLSGNEMAWAGLARLIGRMYEAEQTVSLAQPASRPEMRELLPVIEAKSVLPFVAVQQIASLSRPWSEQSESPRPAGAALGRVVSLTDDLVDLADDCRRGAPNAVALLLADLLAERKRSWPSDADVYDLIYAVAAKLIELLQPGAFGLTGNTASTKLEASTKERTAQQDAPDAGLAAVIDFARLTVAYWVGWQEGDSEAVPPEVSTQDAQSTRSSYVVSATEMLLIQQRGGYQEAIHHLRVPRLSHEGIYIETYPCLLFQRAIILDSLLDAFDAGYHIPQQLLSAEAIAILRAKHSYVRGGWNYIPEVPELPPDADDLGMVLQVLYRVGGSPLASICDEAIQLALDAMDSDGGIPTWILDPHNHSSAEKALHAYIDVVGGRGAHPDVVSNFLYGLILYDVPRFQNDLLKTVAYFDAAQDRRGAWHSRWYAGPYYGTYRVVSVLSVIAADSQGLERARTFLLQSQRPGGSWGVDRDDPLATALAILTLFKLGLCPGDKVVEKGVSYIVANQEIDGGWLASPFISFPKSDGINLHTYSSRTITTAFCLKALLAAEAAGKAVL